MREQRRLAAILAADMVGYSRQMGRDESGTLVRLKTYRGELFEPALARNGGRLVKLTGDGALAVFGSAVDSLRAAIEFQQAVAEANLARPEEDRIVFRIGLHLGDLIVDGDDFYGDGVNIAARLESQAPVGGILVSGALHDAVAGKLKTQLHELGPVFLKNIERPVLTFRADWRGEDWPAPSSSPASGVRGSALDAIPGKANPPRLSVVVLPFANIGGDPEQEYFVDGVTESLTTDLSRMAGMLVIGCKSAFTYKGKQVDLKQVGHELGVRYVLEGSVQRGGNRMRVNAQLIDAASGGHIWAERFDKPLADLFDMQDEIVARLAGQLGTQLITAEARRAERAPNPDSLDLYFQGMAAVARGNTPEYLARATDYFQRALALDPGNIEALVNGAFVDTLRASIFSSTERTAQFAAAEAALTKVLSLAPDHAFAHMCLGLAQIQTNRPAEGIAQCERALALDPNLASAHAGVGLAQYCIGRSEETEAHIQQALRLSPRDSNAYLWMSMAGVAKLFAGRNEEAIGRFRRSLEMNRNNPNTLFMMAAALAEVGRVDEAKAAVQAGLVFAPMFTVGRYRTSAFSNHPDYLAQRERVIVGLLKAGLPE